MYTHVCAYVYVMHMYMYMCVYIYVYIVLYVATFKHPETFGFLAAEGTIHVQAVMHGHPRVAEY